MKLKIFSYRYAKEILEHESYKKVMDEILQICSNCPLPVLKNKSKKQKKLDVVQQIINTYFKLQFKENEWQNEVRATPKSYSDLLRVDFRKTFSAKQNSDSSSQDKKITVQVEVEMGNAASSYRNYFKFQVSFSHKIADISILILPCNNLSKRIDSGVGSFEKTIREIPSANLSITVPILIIGLNDEGTKEIDVSDYSEDLNVIKGSATKDKIEHEKLVTKIINYESNKKV